MSNRIRRATSWVAGGAALVAVHLAMAQSYPVRPVRMIVPFPPGGNTDIIARIVAPRMSDNLGQQIVIDLMAGHVQLQFASMPAVINYARAGKLRMIAQAGAKRSPAAPDTPTMLESGVPGFVISSGFSIYGPANLPRPIVDRVYTSIKAALSNPDVRNQLSGQGADPVGSTPEELDKFNRAEIAKWIKVARDAGIEPQ